MAHIVEFEVEGLAGRDQPYGCRLHRDINMFFGVNGSGKTSLLKILHSAMARDASILADVPVTRAKVVIFSQDYEREFTYVFDRAKELAGDRLDKQKTEFSDLHPEELPSRTQRALRWKRIGAEPKEEGSRPGVKGTSWRHRYLPTARMLRLRVPPHDVPTYPVPDESALDVQFEAALKIYWADFFGEIQGDVRQLQQRALFDIMNEVLTTERRSSDRRGILDWETAYDEMVSFLKRQNPKAKPSPKKAFQKRYAQSLLLRKVIARIDRVEREIEAVMAPRTKLQNLIARLFSKNKTVTFGETSIDVVAKSRIPIGLRALSSGEKHILYILLECLRADQSTIIIDEPEISMHVDWQKELISAMRELNMTSQIIAATHSPEILACVDESKIFRI